MPDTLTIQQWLDVAVDGVKQTAMDVLACDNIQITDPATVPAGHHHGAYVPLIAGEVGVDVGIVLSEDGCRAVTRSLLGMEASEPDPNDEDIVDAVGEIANIFAGLMQRELADQVPSLQLGLPMFVQGRVFTQAGETRTAAVRLDDIETHVVVFRGRPKKESEQ